MKQDKKTSVLVWLTLAFLIVIIAIISDNLSDSVYKEMEDEYSGYQKVLAESSAKTLQLYFGEIETELRLLANSVEIYGIEDKRILPMMVSTLHSHTELLSTIILMDRNGKVRIDPVLKHHQPALIKQLHNIFREMLLKNAKKIAKGETVHLTTTHDRLIVEGQFAGIALASPIWKLKANGKRVAGGMMVALIDRELIEETLLTPMNLSKGGVAMVLTHSGIGITGHNASPKVLEAVKNLSKIEEGKTQLKGMMNKSKATRWIDGILTSETGASIKYPLLVTSAQVDLSDVTWSISIFTPRKLITQLVQKSRLKSLLLASFMMAVLYIGAIILMRINRKKVVAEEHARYADQLAEKNSELEQLNQMKDDFVSIVSHDLRSPIGIIFSYAKMLLPEAVKEQSKSIKPLEAIVRSSERLITLVNDILDIARVEAGEMKLHLSEVNIDTLIAETFKATEYNAEQKEIALTFHPKTEKETIVADNSKIFQVLNNLIGNAIKFTPKNGHIAVYKEIQQQNGKQEIIISVKDNGNGLSEEAQKNIFDKFKQVGSHVGSGLGLAICKNMVELHGGTIWVESNDGEGANFRFTIPTDKKLPKEALLKTV